MPDAVAKFGPAPLAGEDGAALEGFEDSVAGGDTVAAVRLTIAIVSGNVNVTVFGEL